MTAAAGAPAPVGPTARELAQSVAALVRIPSVNPLQGGPVAERHGPIGEGAIAQHLAERLAACGAEEVVLDEVRPGRPNVYAWFPGRCDRLAVIDVHTDTVGVEHMTGSPFDGRVDDEWVRGRGALDTKASLGVLLALLESWHRQGRRPRPRLLVVGTVSEEAGGLLGASRFRQWSNQQGLRIDQLLVAEPTGLRPVHGLKGLVLLQVTAQGRAAHSARPELGVNAIEAMAPVIAAFEAEHRRLSGLEPTTALGVGTVSVTQVSGGTGSNVVPGTCTITVGRRIVPGEDPTEVLAHLSGIARSACPVPCDVASLLPSTPDGQPGRAAFYQPPTGPLVTLLARACGTTPAVAAFGANALRYRGLAEDVVVFGPGCIDDAHQDTERVAVCDLGRLAAAYETWLEPE